MIIIDELQVGSILHLSMLDWMKSWYGFTSIVTIYFLNAVLCGRSTLMFSNQTENHLSKTKNANNDNSFAFNTEPFLKRDKRYLMWTGGGNVQVLTIGFSCEKKETNICLVFN